MRAARPITKATAAGPAFRVREIRLSEQIGGSWRLIRRIRWCLVVHVDRFTLPRARVKRASDPFSSERTAVSRKIARFQKAYYTNPLQKQRLVIHQSPIRSYLEFNRAFILFVS